MLIPDFVMYMMNKLISSGFECYLVGGCVRDTLMGITPHDYDLTTSALPDEMKEVFATDRVIETGIAHGTLTVLSDTSPVEITTYRIDGEYDDNRHPREVSFTRNLHDDLARRDFTVNAMAMSRGGEIVDLYGGREDLQSRTIRCVGNPNKRFREDGLRIMRALRFAATLDFAVEERTALAAEQMCELLCGISVERINAELSKLMCGIGAPVIFERFAEVLHTVLPEIPPDMLRQYSLLINDLPLNLTVRRAALFSLTAHPLDTAKAVMTRLKCSNAERRATYSCVSLMMSPPTDRLGVAHFAAQMGYDLLSTALVAMNRNDILDISLSMQSENVPLNVTDLAINGDSIISLGARRGAEIGDVLNALFTAVIKGECLNTYDDLINMATEIIKKHS